jgi:hypothetical protein
MSGAHTLDVGWSHPLGHAGRNASRAKFSLAQPELLETRVVGRIDQ